MSNYYHFIEEFTQEFNSLPSKIQKLLILYFNDDCEEYYRFENFYETNRYSYDLDEKYENINKIVKNKINRLISYHNYKKKETIDNFMSVVDDMKALFIEPPNNFILCYHIQYFADRNGRGYTIVPYLNRQVAEICVDMSSQECIGKYGSTKKSSIKNCGGCVHLDCNGESPNKPFGLAINCNHH